MAYYNISPTPAIVAGTPATLFRVGFGEPAQNDKIVQAAEDRLAEFAELGGELALINGPASLPVAVVLAHHIVHRFAAVGVFDPKMAAYVVAAAHGGRYSVGDVIPAETVTEAA